MKIFVESAVHFMAESIAILAAPDQEVWITNPKSGCTMEMLAKEFMVMPAFDELHARYGDDVLVVAYMNTSGRVKALAGRTGGAVCTSSNAHVVVEWALAQQKRVLFVPDRHLGEVVAGWAGLNGEDLYLWGGGEDGMRQTFSTMSEAERARCDRCTNDSLGQLLRRAHGVQARARARTGKQRGYRVLVHPECPKPVVDVADGAGSTKYLWGEVMRAPTGAKLAIATEGHFVRNAIEQGALRGVDIVNVADVPAPELRSMGCGCATMSRNDPPHLVAMLDLLRQGRAPDLNRVLAGDVVGETTGRRERLDPAERAALVTDARAALERMIAITGK